MLAICEPLSVFGRVSPRHDSEVALPSNALPHGWWFRARRGGVRDDVAYGEFILAK
jgi:hypothetical protein